MAQQQTDSLRFPQDISEETGPHDSAVAVAQGSNYHHVAYPGIYHGISLRASSPRSSRVFESPYSYPNPYPPLVFDPTITAALPFPGSIASGAYIPTPTFCTSHLFTTANESQTFSSSSGPPGPTLARTPTPEHHHLDFELMEQWLEPEVLYDGDNAAAAGNVCTK